jgi:hypothetical protein
MTGKRLNETVRESRRTNRDDIRRSGEFPWCYEKMTITGTTDRLMHGGCLERRPERDHEPA